MDTRAYAATFLHARVGACGPEIRGLAGIVELDLPVLRPRIVLTKRGSAIFERSAQSLNLRLLSFDFFAQNLVTGGEGFGGLVVLIRLFIIGGVVGV